RSLPIDPEIAGILGVERAFAVAETGDESAGAFLAEDVTVGQAPLADRALDHRGQAAGDVAEESVPGADQLIRTVSIRARRTLWRWQIGRRRGTLGRSRNRPAHQRCERHRSKPWNEFHERTPDMESPAAALT